MKKPAPSRPKGPSKRPVAPEDLTRYILCSDPQISPDSRHVLFTRKHVGEKNDSVSNLWICDATGGKPRQFTQGGKDGQGRWSPDGTRIAFISGREKPNPQIFLISAEGGEAAKLTSFPEGSIGDFKWSPDGKKLALTFREADPEWTEKAKKEREEKGLSIPARVIDDVWYRLDGDGYFNAQRFALYTVDTETGEHKKLFDKDTLGWIEFDWAPSSKELVVSANLDKNAVFKPWRRRLYRVDASTGKHIEIPNQPDGEKSNPQWSPDGKWIAFSGVEGQEDLWSALNDHLFVMDSKNGKPRDLTGSEDYCMSVGTLSDTREAGFGSNYRWSPDSKKLIVQIGWRGEVHVATIDISGGKFKFLTKGAYEHMLGNLSKDGKAVSLAIGHSMSPPEIGIGKLGQTSIETKTLTSFNKKILDELSLSRPESHWIESADGTKVQVWVMLPHGYKSGKLPAVLEVHGGPHAQYGVPFFHEFQVLASAGYAVFFSNPRGSKGYGEAFCNAIKGDWGNRDWIDVQGVIAFMKSRPFVDSKRMGIMGGSYGGYMTNWAIGHTQEFAGAITDRCVSNLLSMALNSDFPFMPDRYWKGNAWSEPDTLWNSSPIKYIGNCKTPTMIIHSEGDLRCNVEQGEQVFTALKVLGIPTRFVRYPSTTSHGMSRSGPADLRVHRLNMILQWWAKYLASKQTKTKATKKS
ncbi:MAG: S9 family peptidase [Fimbriimonadales bacterium]|nr:S9 family peptidase [Fimbriimonadales bacterium]